MPKVLIVDDQGAVRTALEVLFDVHGLETLSARSPSEALSLVANEDVGVVVQDMNFSTDNTSGQEGTALFRAIRQLDPGLPVLLMTAWTSLERVWTTHGSRLTQPRRRWQRSGVREGTRSAEGDRFAGWLAA